MVHRSQLTHKTCFTSKKIQAAAYKPYTSRVSLKTQLVCTHVWPTSPELYCSKLSLLPTVSLITHNVDLDITYSFWTFCNFGALNPFPGWSFQRFGVLSFVSTWNFDVWPPIWHNTRARTVQKVKVCKCTKEENKWLEGREHWVFNVFSESELCDV